MSRRSGPGEGRPGDRVRGLYARLLSLYPKRFRSLYEADLLQAFDDRRGEPRFQGTLGGIRLVLFLLRDFVTSLPITYVGNQRGGRGGIMADFVRDLRFSVRMLAKNPMFTAAAVLTLALGIGLNTATFTAVRDILLAPLAGTEAPEELIQMYRSWPGIEYGSTSIPHYQDVRDRSGEVFENVAVWNFAPMSLSADGRNERILGMLVSANFFQTYGAMPTLGRGFIPGEEDVGPGAHPIVVIGHGFWQTRFGGDPAAIGSTVLLNGAPYEIVGVAPPDFKGPMRVIDVPMYVPLMMLPQIMPGSNLLENRGSNSFTAIGRLRDGQTIERAQEMLDAILLQLKEEYPNSYARQVGTRMVPQSEVGIHPSFGAGQMQLGTVIMAVVALLLLIACVNVANLFLARARDRRREMGIRLSLGAGRGRIVRQLLTESILFSMIAGVAGLGLARLATWMLGRIKPPVDGPWDLAFETDGTVLGFTFLVSVAAGLLFGMAPALQAAKPETVSAVKGEASSKAGGQKMSGTLVVAQMALSLLLLISSGLFLRSLQGATEIDPGFNDPGTLVMATMDPALQGYDEAGTTALYDRLLSELEATPEVTDVSLTRSVPLGFGGSDTSVGIPGYEFGEDEPRNVLYSMIGEGYFHTMGINVIAGREFERSDDSEGRPVIIINEAFADRFWPGESALGRIVETAGEAREIVGVVETGKYRSLGEAAVEFMYFPHRERGGSEMTIIARTSGPADPVFASLNAIVRNADANLPIWDMRTLERHMGIALLPARLGGSVLGIFGILGLILAGVGIYGVMAYSVSQRKRELGIRVALGADRKSVVRMVVAQGMRLAVLGTAIGLVGALGATRLVEGLLYNVSATDPIAFAGVPVLLMAVAALAVYVPAKKAAGVDPIKVLKSD